MERFASADVSVLPDVFAIIWGVEFGGGGDYLERNDWIWVDIGDGGASVPVVFRLEVDADVGHGAR